MKKSKFSESQIVAILKEGDAGVPVAQILRKHGISAYFTTLWDAERGWREWRAATRVRDFSARAGSFGAFLLLAGLDQLAQQHSRQRRRMPCAIAELCPL